MSQPYGKFQMYGKGIVAALYAVAVVAVPQFTGDGRVDAPEGVAIAIAACTAVLTYLVPLMPSAPWTKTAIGAALAGLQVAATVIGSGLDGDDLVLIAAAVLAALGIAVAPAASPTTGTAT